MSQQYTVSFLLVGVVTILLWRNYTKKSSLPLPPGPRPLPLIGNLLDMPTKYQWLVFDKWIQKYGDIVYLNALGQSIVILGTAKRTADIFEKRSSIYSDRVQLPMLELTGWNFSFALMPYSSLWRRHRKCFHVHFHHKAVQKYNPIQIQESREFARSLLDTPEDFLQHIKNLIAAIIVKITYGLQISDGDPYIKSAEEAMDGLAQAGTTLVDLVPILKYMPSWMPGAGFQKTATHLRTVIRNLADQPFDAVKTNMASGMATPSIVTTLLENLPDGEGRADEETIAKHTMATVYIGGSDTTSSYIQSFMLAMTMYPEVQKNAQAELDAIVGHDRLPDFTDRSSLPYINALVKEVIRWQPVTPHVAHYSTVDDEYDGYYIPAKTVVIGNAWTILHDPKFYPNPEEFNPDRFLKDGKLNDEIQDPTVAAFGFGRRICPGRYFANDMIYGVAVTVLAGFKIDSPLDNSGQPVQFEAKMTSGLISFPLPFTCRVVPRSAATVTLIKETHQVNVASD